MGCFIPHDLLPLAPLPQDLSGNCTSAILGPTYIGPTMAMTQGLVKLRMRATASAILLFILNLIGLGLGPQAVGVLSDLLVPTYGTQSIRYVLLFVVVIGSMWSSMHYFLAARTLREDLKAKDGFVGGR
jgi:hypothetical protein